jgi:hypothetical protein
MDPRRDELHREESKAPTQRPEGKPKRFRLLKLEERLAPKKGGNVGPPSGYTCATYCNLSIE